MFHKYRRSLVAVAALVTIFSVAACGSSTKTPAASSASTASSAGTSAGAQPATSASITIKNFAFSPKTLTVAPGTVVTVDNADSATHTVTASGSASGKFNTGDISPGKTMTFTAPTAAGTYPYICNIHQFMQGTLVVT